MYHADLRKVAHVRAAALAMDTGVRSLRQP